MAIGKLKAIVEAPWFSKTIMVLIILNAVILGIETYPAIMAEYGDMLKAIDHLILWIFVAELGLRLMVYRLRFFRDPWSIFDTVVVLIAFMPANEAFAVLRAARVLRVLRLISIFPRLRRVIEGLIGAIPGIGSIGAILIIVYYVFAVMATKLYGIQYPEWFGSLHGSFFTLFQIMTLEGWADIVREIMKTHPKAWIFFVIYILAATFTVLNLFIAVIVDAMQRKHQAEEQEDQDTIKRIETELMKLHQKIDAMKK
ncbi:MAG: ion transporter [Alphaproteobacteria bacterium]|nr:ion transporter [Alphaproteobacteria bacterium]